MRRQQAIDRLRAHAGELRRLGVERLFLFGSTARDEAKPSSDVDLFFDFDDPRFSLIELIRVKERLARILDAPADVTTHASLHPRLRTDIERSAVQVF